MNDRPHCIPPELSRAFARNEVIVCVGSALGRAAGLPDLPALAELLLDEAEDHARAVDAQTLRGWLAAGRTLECLEVLERRLGARFGRIIERAFLRATVPVPALAHAIAERSTHLRAIYTTGLDRLLERALLDAWPSFSAARPDLARRRQLIFKLCGTLEFADSWVLTRAAFEREFNERSLKRELLMAAHRAHCLLFVGFEAGAELDERILHLFDVGDDGRQLPNHFIVLEACAPEQRTLLERRGLSLVRGDPVEVLGQLCPTQQGLNQVSASLPACPYPGLAAFDASLSAVFHGRQLEVSQASARLGGSEVRHRRWLAIEGSSGVGKSSFVHAGVVPALGRGFAEGTPQRWRVATLRPGQRPFRGLTSALATALRPNDKGLREDALERFGQGILAQRDAVANFVDFVRELAPDDAGLLIVVDQLEELLTLSEPGERERFAACLGLLLDQRLVYLITTMRADFGAQLASAAPALGRLLNQAGARYTLAPISRVGLRAAIAEPAAQLGVRFEPELVERIATDAEQHLGGFDDAQGIVRTDDAALPLVAHVLRGLWDVHAASDGVISFAEYKALGGVSGALTQSAEALLQALDERDKRRVRTLLLRMVHVDGERLARRSLRRSEVIAMVGGGAHAERLLARLAGSDGPRLLVVRNDGDRALVDLVHETLLREWDTLRAWIASERAQLARDEALARRAQAWFEAGQRWRSLPRGPERKELLRGRAHGERARAYQRAMRSAGWSRVGIWTAVVIAMLGVGDKLVDAARARDEQQRQLADASRRQDQQQRQLQQAETRARIEDLLDASPARGREALVESMTTLDRDDSVEESFNHALASELILGRRQELVVRAGEPALLGVDHAHDELWLAQPGGPLERGVLGGERVELRATIDESARRFQVAHGGERAVFVTNGHTSLVARDGRSVREIPGSEPCFSADGRHLVVRKTGPKRATIYRSDDGMELWDAPLPNVRALALSTKHIAFAYGPTDTRSRSILALYDLRSGEEIVRVDVDAVLHDVALASPQWDQLISADTDEIRRWSLLGDSGVAKELIEHDLTSFSHAFVESSLDGALMLVSYGDKRIALTNDRLQVEWNMPQVEGIRPLFSPDGRWIVTQPSEHELHLYASSGEGDADARIELDDGSFIFATSRTGPVVSHEDGTVSYWPVNSERHWATTLAEPRRITALAFEPGAPSRIHVADSSGSIAVWSPGASAPKPVAQLGSSILALSITAGNNYVALTKSGTLHRWSVSHQPQAGQRRRCDSSQAGLPPSSDVLVASCPERVRGWYSTTTLAVARAGTIELTGRASQGLAADSVSALALDGAGRRLVAGDNDGKVMVWNLDNGSTKPVLLRGLQGLNVESVAISPSGQWIAAGVERHGKIGLWGADGQLSPLLACPGHHVEVLGFSPDSERLVAGCSDGSVHAWAIGLDAKLDLACHRLTRVSTADSELPPQCSRAPNPD